MVSIGKNIKRLRMSKGDTQEQFAEKLQISGQAVSKWENDAALPDISLIPLISDYFGVTIDELFDHKLNSYTYKERFVKLMCDSGVLLLKDGGGYYINSEKFSTNAHIAKIGECFADFIRDNNIEFDAIMGMAYHGVAFSTATACALYQKYGITTSYFHDRRSPDSRGRLLCGYTPENGDRIVVIDDMIGSGDSLDARLEGLSSKYDIKVSAVIVIADAGSLRLDGGCGSEYICKKYGTRVFSIISDDDVQSALNNQIV